MLRRTPFVLLVGLAIFLIAVATQSLAAEQGIAPRFSVTKFADVAVDAQGTIARPISTAATKTPAAKSEIPRAPAPTENATAAKTETTAETQPTTETKSTTETKPAEVAKVAQLPPGEPGFTDPGPARPETPQEEASENVAAPPAVEDSGFGAAESGSPDIGLSMLEGTDGDTCGNRCGMAGEDTAGKLRVFGWLDGGVMLNGSSPPSRFNGPYNAIDNDGGMFNQAYLVAERTLDPRSVFDVGGRLDVLYGYDFFLAQSAGVELETNGSLRWNNQYYGLAMPQAYGQVGNSELSVKLGHFYTIIGYEGVPAVNNFFYTKAYSYMFAGPFTHWGGLATWTPNSQFTLDAGIVNGWNALDRTVNRATFMGRATLKTSDENLTTSLGVITGDEDTRTAAGAQNRTRYSWITTTKFDRNWEYVFHQWLGYQADALPNNQSALWYGIDQYLFYTMNSKWQAGFRFEWFRDEQGVRVGLNRPSNPNKPPFPGSFYSGTFGLYWTPRPSITIRPSIRVDWYHGLNKPFADGNSVNQLLVGTDAIWTF